MRPSVTPQSHHETPTHSHTRREGRQMPVGSRYKRMNTYLCKRAYDRLENYRETLGVQVGEQVSLTYALNALITTTR